MLDSIDLGLLLEKRNLKDLKEILDDPGKETDIWDSTFSIQYLCQLTKFDKKNNEAR